jgi:radical SAM superfamily enzyme YgiQ (UPF0313 family)
MDVLLIIPLTHSPIYREGFRSPYLRSIEEYMGVEYICAVLRNRGVEVQMVDTRLPDFDIDNLCHTIKEQGVKVVGISDVQDSHRHTLQLSRLIKTRCEPVRIVLGGHYPTACYEDILKNEPDIDVVVLGEGEYTFPELVKRILSDQTFSDIPGIAFFDHDSNRVVRTEDKPLLENLDELPFPARDLLPVYAGYRGEGSASIISSRGCYGKCAFCSISSFYRRFGGRLWRGRSPGNVITEIEKIIKDYGIHHFTFCDDNFLGGGKRSRERVYRWAEMLEKKKLGITFSFMCRANDVESELFRLLKRVGLTIVFIGIEAMNAGSLDFLDKGVTKEQNRRAMDTLLDLGIQCEPGMIMFDFSSTLGGIRENLGFLKYYLDRTKDKGIHYSYLKLFSFLKVYRGTPLEGKIKKYLSYDKDKINPSYRILDPKAYFLKEIAFRAIRNRTKPVYKRCRELEEKWADEEDGKKEVYSLKARLYDFTIEAMLKLIDIIEEDKPEVMGQFENYVDTEIKHITSSLEKLSLE